MILLEEIKKYERGLTGNIEDIIEFFPTVDIRLEREGDGSLTKKVYVSKEEYNMYEEWRNAARKHLIEKCKDAALLDRIARRHHLR